MRRRIAQFERLDMGQRPRRGQTGHVRHRRMRSQIEENPLGQKDTRGAVVELYLDRLRRDEPPGAHDEFGAGFLEGLDMKDDLALDHVALALTNLLHVDGDGADLRAKLRGVTRDMRDPRAPDLVFTRHAGDVGTGAADPFSLDAGSPAARSRQFPGEQFAALSTPKNEIVVSFGLRHVFLRFYAARKSRIAAAISAACVSSAKCPVSRNWMTAFEMSRLNASAPAGKKNGSFLPHTASSGGL